MSDQVSEGGPGGPPGLTARFPDKPNLDPDDTPLGGSALRVQKYPVPREIGICPLRLIAHCFDKDIKTICIGPDCEFWRLDIDEKEKVDNGQCGLINF